MRFSAMKKLHPPAAHRIDEDVNNDDNDDIVAWGLGYQVVPVVLYDRRVHTVRSVYTEKK
jgi:hypothetical protein